MGNKLLAFAFLGLLAACSGTTLPPGVLNNGNCDVAGTASIPGAVNLSFQCSGTISQQGPPATLGSLRPLTAAEAPVQSMWPIPPAPSPFPPLPSH